MKKEINGKTYELVENTGSFRSCDLCAFGPAFDGCKTHWNECLENSDDERLYWKEVSDEQN